MKNNEKESMTDNKIRDFLSAYQDEEVSVELRERVLDAVRNSSLSPIIIKLEPMWKRLSLAASIAAFALGVVMSNQVFASTSTSSSDLSYGETGLYSYVMEGE